LVKTKELGRGLERRKGKRERKNIYCKEEE
jgi:hypothetical protein